MEGYFIGNLKNKVGSKSIFIESVHFYSTLLTHLGIELIVLSFIALKSDYKVDQIRLKVCRNPLFYLCFNLLLSL